ncbi:MAG: hypothetical protein M1313_02090 [Nitrospirae bacterium]|nr:hypothetical protein [Nitrospirota bacterium]
MIRRRERLSPRELRHTGRQGRASLLFLLPLLFLFLLPGCSGSTNFSGSTPALPNGQTGSVAPLGAAPGNCYVSDSSSAACSTTQIKGSYGITALATVTYGTTPTSDLFVGNGHGNISYVTVPASSKLPTTPTTCISSTGPAISSLALIPTTTSAGTLFYSTSAGVFTLSTSSCSSSSPTSIKSSSVLTYIANQIVGVTTAGTYFTCTGGTPSCTSQGPLPHFKGATVNVTAIASDPQYPVVYVATSTNGSYAVNIYSVSGTTLTFLGSYSGGELSAPVGIALFHGPNPAQNYCTGTTGGCNFLDVLNAGSDAITQYVLTYTLSSGTPTGVSLNQYNGAYLGCELFDPSALAAISDPALGAPAVFLGENGTSFGPCQGVPSGTSFGNNVTAYTVNGE